MKHEKFTSLKPGDKVRVIDTPISNFIQGIKGIDSFCGKTVTVAKSNYYLAPVIGNVIDIVEDNDQYFWTKEMLC